MEVKSGEWNVVVAGSWNPAILTPAGVAEHVFGLPPGSAVDVSMELAINQFAPPRVGHENLQVVVDHERLIVGLTTPSFTGIEKAREACVRAINALPRTPLRAAGFNLRFIVEEPDADFVALSITGVDTVLADGGFEIERRRFWRQLPLEDESALNLSVEQQSDEKWLVSLNVHFPSTDPDKLAAWLQSDLAAIKGKITSLLDLIHLSTVPEIST